MTSLPVSAVIEEASESLIVLDVTSHREQFDMVSCTPEVCAPEILSIETHNEVKYSVTCAENTNCNSAHMVCAFLLGLCCCSKSPVEFPLLKSRPHHYIFSLDLNINDCAAVE